MPGEATDLGRRPLACIPFLIRPQKVLHFNGRRNGDLASAGGRSDQQQRLTELRQHCAAVLAERLMLDRSGKAGQIDQRLLKITR